MKRLLLILSLLTTICASARTAADFFVEAPRHAIPLLDRNTRLDMVDYYNGGFQNTVKNAFGGPARIISMSDNQIEVQLSRDSSIKLAVLKDRKDTVLVVIETVLTPVADSDITIYSKNWDTYANQLAMPSVVDFVKNKKLDKNIEYPKMAFMTTDVDPENNIFTFHNTTAGYYSDVDRPQGLEHMMPSIQCKFAFGRLSQIKSKK